MEPTYDQEPKVATCGEAKIGQRIRLLGWDGEGIIKSLEIDGDSVFMTLLIQESATYCLRAGDPMQILDEDANR